MERRAARAVERLTAGAMKTKTPSWQQRLEAWRRRAPWRGWLLRWRSLRTGPHNPMLLGRRLDNTELGKLGELLAARWLATRGRKVLYRNYRGLHRGEVDLVCRHGRVLAFVEVKTRSGDAFGRPADAVTWDKQWLIQRGAQDWLRRLGHPPITFRFDIAEVLLVPGHPPRFNVIENAFQLPEGSMEGRVGREASGFLG